MPHPSYEECKLGGWEGDELVKLSGSLVLSVQGRMIDGKVRREGELENYVRE